MYRGASQKKCLKALMFNSDSVIFDLEDAVAENQKDAARFSLYHAPEDHRLR